MLTRCFLVGCYFFFFFQAEDGIRDLVRSRGLGDVYKRQAFDVVHILKKGRQSIVSCDAQVEAVRSDEVPAVFTKIHLHFKVSGDNIKENIVRNAVKLSAEKYCSASIMLSKGGVEITHSLELT